MNLTDARKAKIPRKKKFPVGKGQASGAGKQCGRGRKGQGARQGESQRPYFEGGQMPVIRRIPKFGFNNNAFRLRFETVNVGDLDEKFADGDVVDQDSLRAKGLVNRRCDGIKILGDGPLAKKLTVKAERFSASALEKIAKAGGKAEAIGAPPAPAKQG
ncbi:MAG: 50S ribosomal protein L15 [Planctomycetes bacterium]|nr:50S ribosomal protein L15 [Planctomycetota bacterium]